jgi:hypothetical protein
MSTSTRVKAMMAAARERSARFHALRPRTCWVLQVLSSLISAMLTSCNERARRKARSKLPGACLSLWWRQIALIILKSLRRIKNCTVLCFVRAFGPGDLNANKYGHGHGHGLRYQWWLRCKENSATPVARPRLINRCLASTVKVRSGWRSRTFVVGRFSYTKNRICLTFRGYSAYP